MRNILDDRGSLLCAAIVFWVAAASSETLAQQRNRPRLPDCMAEHVVGNWKILAFTDFASATPADVRRIHYLQQLYGYATFRLRVSKGTPHYLLDFSLRRPASAPDFEVTLAGSALPQKIVRKQSKVFKPIASDSYPQELDLTDLFPTGKNPLLVSPDLSLKVNHGGEQIIDMQFSSQGFRDVQPLMTSLTRRVETMLKQKKCTEDIDF